MEPSPLKLDTRQSRVAESIKSVPQTNLETLKINGLQAVHTDGLRNKLKANSLNILHIPLAF